MKLLPISLRSILLASALASSGVAFPQAAHAVPPSGTCSAWDKLCMDDCSVDYYRCMDFYGDALYCGQERGDCEDSCCIMTYASTVTAMPRESKVEMSSMRDSLSWSSGRCLGAKL